MKLLRTVWAWLVVCTIGLVLGFCFLIDEWLERRHLRGKED